jgi:hypothetical protein
VSYTIDDLIDLALSAVGVREIVQWPVEKGNGLVLMNFVRRMTTRARIGDRIKVTGGGFVEKIADTGWVQWRYYPEQGESPPLTGRAMQGPPARFPAQSAAGQ